MSQQDQQPSDAFARQAADAKARIDQARIDQARRESDDALEERLRLIEERLDAIEAHLRSQDG